MAAPPRWPRLRYSETTPKRKILRASQLRWALGGNPIKVA
jgi:hypothetical protein